MPHLPHCGYVLGLKPPLPLRGISPKGREKLPNNADFFPPLGGN